jgi:NADPH:quinone reductase-like Zn-dependent oxidoreductase
MPGNRREMAMKAVRIHEYGGPDKLQLDDDVPEPPIGPHSVLIETVAAGVNPIDWKVRSGARQKDMPMALPGILGRDVSGVVQQVGTEVTTFKAGDRVLAMTHGTYAELVVVDESLVTRLPDGLTLVDAAAIPLVSLTGDQLVRRATAVQPGQTLVVTGALGSVGRAALHSAMKLGVHAIAGVRARQLSEAESLHAADLLAIDDERALATLEPVDAVADTVGGLLAANLLAKVKPGGSFGYASVLPEGTAEQHADVRVKRVLGSADPSTVREYAEDILEGNFVLPIGRRLALRDAAQAHILGERGGVGKIVLIAR